MPPNGSETSSLLVTSPPATSMSALSSTSHPAIWMATPNATSSPGSAAGRSLSGSPDGPTIGPSGPAPVRASLSARQAKEQGLLTSGPATQWLDLVSSDLEALGYAFGAAALPACSVGAPHIRQRTWFVADAEQRGCQGRDVRSRTSQATIAAAHRVEAVRLADDIGAGLEGRDARPLGRERPPAERGGEAGAVVNPESEQMGLSRRARQPGSTAGGLGNTRRAGTGRDGGSAPSPKAQGRGGGISDGHGGCDGAVAPSAAIRLADANQPVPGEEREQRGGQFGGAGEDQGTGPWSDLEWLPCRDGKARPTQPGLLPLAHGVSGRVGKLRAYGNAIVPQVGAAFIRACLSAADDQRLRLAGGVFS